MNGAPETDNDNDLLPDEFHTKETKSNLSLHFQWEERTSIASADSSGEQKTSNTSPDSDWKERMITFFTASSWGGENKQCLTEFSVRGENLLCFTESFEEGTFHFQERVCLCHEGIFPRYVPHTAEKMLRRADSNMCCQRRMSAYLPLDPLSNIVHLLRTDVNKFSSVVHQPSNSAHSLQSFHPVQHLLCLKPKLRRHLHTTIQ